MMADKLYSLAVMDQLVLDTGGWVGTVSLDVEELLGLERIVDKLGGVVSMLLVEDVFAEDVCVRVVVTP